MNFLKPSMLFLLSAAFLFSCGGNDKKEGEKIDENPTDSGPLTKLNGAWEIVRAEGPAIKSNLGTVYTFEGDNLTMGKDGFDNPGKTEITDSTFSFQAKGNEYKFLFHYLFEGDTLVTSMENSNGQRFFMVKK